MFALILSVCLVSASGAEDCDSLRYVVDTSPVIEDCIREMDANPQTMPDRFLSCEWIDGQYLKPPVKKMTAAQALDQINHG